METQKSSKKQSKKRKYIISIGLTLAIILIGTTSFFVVAHSYVSKVNYVPVDKYDIKDVSSMMEEDMEESNMNLQESAPEDVKNLETQIDANITNNNGIINDETTEKKVKNILLIGSDSRQAGAAGRSDTMILVSINEDAKKIIATSFLRDIYLQIPGLTQKNRLNVAYSYGGAGLLIDTIKENFKVEIDNYVAIDFYSFMNVVDAIGGVTLTVSEDEIKVMNQYINELNKLLNQPGEEDKLLVTDAGTIHLNGKQALAYSRVRYVGNADFERTSRQRMVLVAAYKNVKGQNFTKLNNLINIILPEISTDLTESELLGFIKNAASYKDYDIEEWSIPYENKHTNLVIKGMQVLGIDFDENINQLHQKIDGLGKE